MINFVAAGTDASLERRLASFSFYQEMSDAGKEQLLANLQPMEIGSGQELLDEGAMCQALLLVEAGAIRVYKMSQSGREITLYDVVPGESCVLGMSCVVNDQRYPAHAVCSGDSTALAVPAGLFRQLYDSEPSVRTFVMDHFSRRLANLMLLVEEVAFRRMDERLATFLVEKGSVAPGIVKPVEMSHEEIASHLGTAREVVSRMLQQFVEEGLVRLERKKVILLQVEELTARAGAL